MKKVWFSKIVLASIIQFMLGTSMGIAQFIEAGSYSPTAIATALIAVLVVVWRIWFTTDGLEV